MKNTGRLSTLVACTLATAPVIAQRTEFIYQGRIQDGSGSVNGSIDAQFALFDDETAGNQVSSIVQVPGIAVNDGLFTTELDFGDVFNGQQLYLEVAIDGDGLGTGDDPTTMTPRVKFTKVPEAMYAMNAGRAEVATSIEVDGDGGLSIQDATDSSGQNIGDPSPSLVGGSSINQILDGAAGAVIVGGGDPDQGFAPFPNLIFDDHGFIGTGRGNVVGSNDGDASSATHSSVLNGAGNNVSSSYSVIAGGFLNSITDNADYSIIGAGFENDISNSEGGFVGAGYDNDIFSAEKSFIGAGQENTISASDNSVIVGGDGNFLGLETEYSVISGGRFNSGKYSRYSFIGSGFSNEIEGSGGLFPYSNTILNGENNSIFLSDHSSILGGKDNYIDSGTYSTILNGSYNFIETSNHSLIANGSNNSVINADFAFAAGNNSEVADGHDGTFVWSDSSSGPFASTDSDQFLIEAANGVGIKTNDPTEDLHVEGDVRVTGQFRDSSNSAGSSGQILSSTATGTQWIDAPTGGGSSSTIEVADVEYQTGTIADTVINSTSYLYIPPEDGIITLSFSGSVQTESTTLIKSDLNLDVVVRITVTDSTTQLAQKWVRMTDIISINSPSIYLAQSWALDLATPVTASDTHTIEIEVYNQSATVPTDIEFGRVHGTLRFDGGAAEAILGP